MSEKDKIQHFIKEKLKEADYTHTCLSGRLHLPKQLAHEMSCYCPGCGKPLRGTNPQVWFGDYFCGPCVENYKRGGPSR